MKSIIRSLFVVIVLVTLQHRNVFAQHTGYPIRNYSPKEYGAFMQNWFCVQDSRGVLFFGNSSNVIEYDGRTWKKIPIVKGVAVRTLCISKSGIIYVGSVGDFGYLKPESNGTLVYKSLTPLIANGSTVFADVWNIAELNGAIIFQTSEFLYVYKNGRILDIKPSQNTFASISFSLNNKLFFRERKIGMKQFDGDKLSLIPQGEKLQNSAIIGMINFPERTSKTILALSVDEGFFDITENSIDKHFAPSENELIQVGPLGMQWFNDSTIILNTRSGVYFLDKHLHIISTISKQDGLQDESISNIYFDSQNEMWLSTNNGISKVSVHSPFYYYNSNCGFNGNIEAITIVANNIYVGTTSGMYVAELGNNNEKGAPGKLLFTTVQGTFFETWNFKSNGKSLFAATSDGIFEIIGNKANRVSKAYSNTIYFPKNNPLMMFAGEKDGVRLFENKAGKWIDKKYFNFPTIDIMNIAIEPQTIEQEQQKIWLTTRNSGVYRMSLNKDLSYDLEKYGKEQGLPDEQIYLFERDNNIYFNTTNHVYEFNKNRSLHFSVLNNNVSAYNHNSEPIPLLDQKFPESQRTQRALRAIEDQGYSFYQSGKDILWTGLTDVMTRYDASVKKNYSPEYNALIRDVIVGKDSLLFGGTFFQIHGNNSVVVDSQPQNMIIELDYRFNTILFNYSAAFYDREDKLVFSHTLVGFDTTWSDWSPDSKKQYTNLYEGEYTFEVKAKNIYEHESKIATYTFVIKPPMYRTTWAYITYFILFLLLVFCIVRISVWRLRNAKIKLENIVVERTTEVVKQKEELQEKNTIIEVAYNDIKSSINYAKRIQEAILPLNPEIKKQLPQSFILFKPRDVVSGDFYWFYKTGSKIVIACVDCTGHGVPGAFMSMIGNTLLNEIVIEKNIVQPSQILNLLHERVRQSLKQDLEKTETRDGMDIAICVLNESLNRLEYAGANRNLIIVRNKELIEIKANKQPIGGDQMEQDRIFTNHEFILQQEDSIYMTTDGYADQFGGEKGKKFMVKRFHQTLLDIQQLSMEMQGQKLLQIIEEWKGNNEQVDDILVIGFKYSNAHG